MANGFEERSREAMTASDQVMSPEQEIRNMLDALSWRAMNYLHDQLIETCATNPNARSALEDKLIKLGISTERRGP